MDEQMDIGDCRVAFATENTQKFQCKLAGWVERGGGEWVKDKIC